MLTPPRDEIILLQVDVNRLLCCLESSTNTRNGSWIVPINHANGLSFWLAGISLRLEGLRRFCTEIYV